MAIEIGEDSNDPIFHGEPSARQHYGNTTHRLTMEQQVWCVGLCGVLGGERVLGQEHLGPGHGGAVHTVAVGGTGGWARYRWSL